MAEEGMNLGDMFTASSWITTTCTDTACQNLHELSNEDVNFVSILVDSEPFALQGSVQDLLYTNKNHRCSHPKCKLKINKVF
jgi:hypothetical protein